MKKGICVITLLFIMAAFPVLRRPLHGQEGHTMRNSVAVFAVPGEGLEAKTVTAQSVSSVIDVLERCGRLMPLDRKQVQTALIQAPKKEGVDEYRTAAESLKCDLYIIITAYRGMKKIYGGMKVVSLSDKFKHLEREFATESGIPMIIPLKLAREAARMHENLPLEATIERIEKGTHVLDVGQWHGIVPGEYKTADGNDLFITGTGRYLSTARIKGAAIAGMSLVISAYPDAAGEMKRIERRMLHVLSQKHEGVPDPDSNFMVSLCIYNPAAGACVPGYGSYLSAENLAGGSMSSASVPGVILSLGLVFTHFTLTEFMTGFKTNFFPWIRDGDKTRDVQRLQIFLWASLPLTYSVSYMDQLAHILSEAERIPPFFMSGDEAAAALSLFIPGGGLFYKGHRLAGWGYYTAEMFLAGFGLYRYGSGDAFLYSYIALGIIKVIEIVHAYFIDFGYDYYRREMDSDVSAPAISFGMDLLQKREPVYRLSAQTRF